VAAARAERSSGGEEQVRGIVLLRCFRKSVQQSPCDGGHVDSPRQQRQMFGDSAAHRDGRARRRLDEGVQNRRGMPLAEPPDGPMGVRKEETVLESG
jgi:hypothetical protein